MRLKNTRNPAVEPMNVDRNNALQNTRTFDPAVESMRRSVDRNNAWLQENPRTVRHRKSAPRQSPGAERTGLCLAALVTLAHVNEAAATSNSPRNGRGPQADNAPQKHPPSTKASEGVQRGSIQKLPNELGMATHNETGGRTSMRLSALPRAFLQTERRSSGITTSGTSTTLGSVFHEARQRLKRDLPDAVVNVEPRRQANRQPVNSLALAPFDRARLEGVKELLAGQAEDAPPAELLSTGNEIIRNASADLNNKEARLKARALLKLEAKHWALENGGDNVVPERDYMQAYVHDRNLASRPPHAPQFKTEREILRDIISTPNAQPLSKDGSQPIITKAAKDEYQRQFTDYIKNDLPRLCHALVRSSAVKAGIPRLYLESRPTTIWEISNITGRRLEWSPTRRHVDLVEDRAMPARLMALPNGKFVFIDPEGKLHCLDRNPFPAKDADSLRKLYNVLIKHLNLNHHGYNKLSVSTKRTSNRSGSPPTIKDWAVQKCQETLVKNIRSWERTNDPELHSKWAEIRVVLEGMGLVALIAAELVLEVAQPELAPELIPEMFAEVEEVAELAGESLAAKSGGLAANVFGDSMLELQPAVKLEEGFAGLGERAAQEEIVEAEGGVVQTSADETLEGRPLECVEGVRLTGRHKRGQLLSCIGGGLMDAERFLNDIYSEVARPFKAATPEEVAEYVNEQATATIPETLYRGQPASAGTSIGSRFGEVGAEQRDDYIVALLKHSARTEGGEHVSLTMRRLAAEQFAERNEILRISTNFDRANFRTTADLVKNEGPRLVASGKLRREDLVKTVDHMMRQKWGFQEEQEVFYLGGSIPGQHISPAS